MASYSATGEAVADADFEAVVIATLDGRNDRETRRHGVGTAQAQRGLAIAAGIVLFELVCARPLFHGKGKEALEMVKSGAIPRPRDFAHPRFVALRKRLAELIGTW